MESAHQWFERELRQVEDDPEYRTELLLIELNDQICAQMERTGMSRADLARKLGVSRAAVTRMLNGSPNMTLKKLVTVALALGVQVSVELRPTDMAARTERKHSTKKVTTVSSRRAKTT